MHLFVKDGDTKRNINIHKIFAYAKCVCHRHFSEFICLIPWNE